MLIMCHPGCSNLELRRIGSLTSLRNAELALSEEWPQLLLKNRLQLGRLRRLGEHPSPNSRRSKARSSPAGTHKRLWCMLARPRRGRAP
jgi:hypothetical protein